MRPWKQAVMTELASARSVEQTFALVRTRARSLGFDACAYGARYPLPVSKPSFLMYSNYPATWQKRYIAENYFACDPIVRYGMTRTAPLIWPVEAGDSEFWQEAHAHRITHDWSQPIRDSHGYCAMLSVSRDSEAITGEELAVNEGRLIFLANSAHVNIFRFTHPSAHNMLITPLTTREKEVLKWTADGKTAAKISMILSVSERTITFHTVNIINKLGARNKTQACVKAALLGVVAEIF